MSGERRQETVGTSRQALLAAERAVRRGAAMLRQGRTHIGALIPKGDRDFATAVDVTI